MSNMLSLDLVLNRQKYPLIYQTTAIILLIIIISTFLIFTVSYQTYYETNGKIVNSKLELFIKLDDLKYLNNNIIYIDNKKKDYHIETINKELYASDNYENYCCLYLDIEGLSNIENYIYKVKIHKENKKIIKYLKDYLS